MALYYHVAAEQLSEELPVCGRSGERLLAAHNALIQALQTAISPFTLRLIPSSRSITLSGDKVAVMVAVRLLKPLCEQPTSHLSPEAAASSIVGAAISEVLNHDFALRLSGLLRPLQTRSLAQLAFLYSLLAWSDKIVVGIGPTGTGKTHMALAAALNQLAEDRVKHIVITRPHLVMEGEIVTTKTRLELEYDDQFEYLEDMLRDLVGQQEYRNLIEARRLALTPLGHLRGRTLNDTFLIIDEAQNLSIAKMRMAVTRIGRASRMALTGDPQRTDLRANEPSGLLHLLKLVQGTDLAKVERFDAHDVIRNHLVHRLEQLFESSSD